ncbi:MAG: hypothetical protein OEZ59_13180 [Deltaproteobacteria bacterium]|nr:hypothetical protein [Deltaproteobacteria bacterium]
MNAEISGDALRWETDNATVSRRQFLELRHKALMLLREHFASRGYLEADTPVLVRCPSPEAVFQPIAAGEGRYLITSPEFQLKRMLTGGFERIYRLGPVFRGGETGDRHNPEFCLLEWYRAGAGLEELSRELAALLNRLAPLADMAAGWWKALAESSRLQTGGNAQEKTQEKTQEKARQKARQKIQALEELGSKCRAAELPSLTVARACREALGIDIRGAEQGAHLLEAVRGLPLAGELSPDWDFTALFSRIWLEVEQSLPAHPLLVTEWPAPLASLARLKEDDQSVAERVELYAGGLELANGFAELTDPAEQRRRFQADLRARERAGLGLVPLDEKFLGALEEGLPPAAGMALGVDRLVMLLGGADSIREVLPFAWDEL